MKAQRALAVVLTVGFFGLVIVGMGALFALFDHRVWGYVVGALACAVMAGAAVRAARSDDSGGPSGRPGAAQPRRQPSAQRPAGSGRPGRPGGGGRGGPGRASPSGRPGNAGRPGRTGRR